MDLHKMKLDKLVEYTFIHHSNLKKATVSLNNKAWKISEKIYPLFLELNDNMEQYLSMKEAAFYPFLKNLLQNKYNAELISSSVKFIESFIKKIKLYHKNIQKLLKKIRLLSNNFNPSTDSSPTIKLYYAQLFNFEQDMKKHIFLEENILFPKLLEFDKRTKHQ